VLRPSHLCRELRIIRCLHAYSGFSSRHWTLIDRWHRIAPLGPERQISLRPGTSVLSLPFPKPTLSIQLTQRASLPHATVKAVAVFCNARRHHQHGNCIVFSSCQYCVHVSRKVAMWRFTQDVNQRNKSHQCDSYTSSTRFLTAGQASSKIIVTICIYTTQLHANLCCPFTDYNDMFVCVWQCATSERDRKRERKKEVAWAVDWYRNR